MCTIGVQCAGVVNKVTMEPQFEHNKFDLSDFMTDSLSLYDNLSPHSIAQYKKDEKDPINEFLKINPRKLLGFYNFGKPRLVAEDTVGTPIQEFYKGMNILITGGSGFIGKALIEKLTRSIPNLNQIYVLLRSKKGVSAKERFEKVLEDEVFLRIKTEVPEYLSKLTLVEGDISEPDLGLSEMDRQMLQSQVHIVFHSAADVRFVNTLRTAMQTNLIGSKRVIELAKGMTNLKSYVHVSTAFSNCVNRVIEERIYTPTVGYQEILQLLNEKTDDEIKKDEERILLGWPNTYTFSKALCEDMIGKEAKDLPICIFRPSIEGLGVGTETPSVDHGPGWTWAASNGGLRTSMGWRLDRMSAVMRDSGGGVRTQGGATDHKGVKGHQGDCWR